MKTKKRYCYRCQREKEFQILEGTENAVLRGSSHAVLRGSSHAVLWENSHAVLWENSHAVLRGSSHAVLRGSSHAVGSKYSSITLHGQERKSTRLNSSHSQISYAVFCLKKKKNR